MIVKNESRTLARCLESVRPAVDRILIGDTGSSDETLSIAQSYGAETLSVPWTGDFAAARNAVLRHGQCDWILVLDADEMLDPEGATMLRRLIQQPDQHRSPAAYDVCRWNYVLETNSRSGEEGALPNPYLIEDSRPFPAYVRSLNTRLFRRSPEIFFERPVHETVVHRVRASGLPIATAPFVIHHFGQAEGSRTDRLRKNELYHRIGLTHLRENPTDARTCFELGLGELEHFKRPEAALSLFQQALAINPRDVNSLLFAGVCLVRTRRYQEALGFFSRALELGSSSLVLDESIGDAHFHQQQYLQAQAAYENALHKGSASALVVAKWGVCNLYSGQREQGLNALRQALQREPDFPELLDVVAAGAALAQEYRFAADVARRRLPLEGTSASHFALACALLRSLNDWTAHQEILRAGMAKFPDDPSLSAERSLLSNK